MFTLLVVTLSMSSSGTYTGDPFTYGNRNVAVHNVRALRVSCACISTDSCTTRCSIRVIPTCIFHCPCTRVYTNTNTHAHMHLHISTPPPTAQVGAYENDRVLEAQKSMRRGAPICMVEGGYYARDRSSVAPTTRPSSAASTVSGSGLFRATSTAPGRYRRRKAPDSFAATADMSHFQVRDAWPMA